MAKTREEIVQECTNWVTVCWDYYSDDPLETQEIATLKESLDDLLPKSVKTED